MSQLWIQMQGSAPLPKDKNCSIAFFLFEMGLMECMDLQHIFRKIITRKQTSQWFLQNENEMSKQSHSSSKNNNIAIADFFILHMHKIWTAWKNWIDEFFLKCHTSCFRDRQGDNGESFFDEPVETSKFFCWMGQVTFFIVTGLTCTSTVFFQFPYIQHS